MSSGERPHKPRWMIVLGAVLILVGIGVAWRLSHRTGPQYVTLTLQPENLVETIEVSGMVQSERAVTLKAPVGAQVLARLQPENQRVKAGTPLLKLDTEALALQLKQARVNAQSSEQQALQEVQTAREALSELERNRSGNLLNLRNALQQAEENLFFVQQELQRRRKLLAAGALASQQIDQQEQELKQAQLRVANARTSLNTAEQANLELSNARNRLSQAETSLRNSRAQGLVNVRLASRHLQEAAIQAPFTGSITSWSVNRGDYVTPGLPLAQFQDLSDLRLLLSVNELDFPKISTGAPVEIIFDAYPERSFKGSVVWLSKASTASSENLQVFPVKIWFDNAQELIRPGMSGDARITVGTRSQVLAIPLGAIEKKEGKYYVKVLRADKPESVEITVGMSTLEKVEVRSGLKVGDQVMLENTKSEKASESSHD